MHIQKYRRNEFVPLMLELARLYHPKTYVEIGISDGHTFNQMAQLSQIEKLVGVDIKDGVNTTGRIETHYNTNSQQFAKMWAVEGKPIDMLFIDADHNKETVAHDFFEIGKFVKDGTGLILMHDTHPMTEELLQPQFCNNAWEFADHLFQQVSLQSERGIWSEDCEHSLLSSDIEILTLPGPWAGLTIVRKRGQHHLCWKNEDG